jgi:hypothetical protein
MDGGHGVWRGLRLTSICCLRSTAGKATKAQRAGTEHAANTQLRRMAGYMASYAPVRPRRAGTYIQAQCNSAF